MTTYNPDARIEFDLWSDAWHIAVNGASNPRAVERTLNLQTDRWGNDHPAIRAMAGHLAFLQGTSLGPEPDDLRTVEANAKRLRIII